VVTRPPHTVTAADLIHSRKVQVIDLDRPIATGGPIGHSLELEVPTSKRVWAIARWTRQIKEDNQFDRSAPESMPCSCRAAGQLSTIEKRPCEKAARPVSASPRHPHPSGAITPDDAMAPASQSTDSPCSSPWPASPWLKEPGAGARTLRRKPRSPWRSWNLSGSRYNLLKRARSIRSPILNGLSAMKDLLEIKNFASKSADEVGSQKPSSASAFPCPNRACNQQPERPGPSASLPFPFTAPEPMATAKVPSPPCWTSRRPTQSLLRADHQLNPGVAWTTTKSARPKALRNEAERMITLAKGGSPGARRRPGLQSSTSSLVHPLF